MSRRRKKRSKYIGVIILLLVVVGGIFYLISNNEKLSESDIEKENTKKEDKTDTEIEEDESIIEETEEPSEEVREYTVETQTGEEIKVEANKMVTATGFSGASNYKYYLRGTTLYFQNVSSSENKEEIIAYNVKDIYLENKEVVAELYEDGKIVKENNYITYK